MISGTVDLAAYRGTLPRVDGIPSLSPAEALDLVGRGAVLVDLREAYETNFRVFAVDRVVYLPWTRFAEFLDRLPKDEALILADASGIYCREAARLLVGQGYINIGNLAGGMIDWDAEGYPVRKDDDFELRGQCACKMKSRHGGNPLVDKREDARG